MLVFYQQQLAGLGINVFFHTVVGDNPERLKSAIEMAENRSKIIIFTGGLGPTKDDLTKETIAKHLGKKLVIDQQALESIELYFKRTSRVMTENNRKQALVIEGITFFQMIMEWLLVWSLRAGSHTLYASSWTTEGNGTNV